MSSHSDNGQVLASEHFSGNDAKIKWRPDEHELKYMGSVFEAREFFQDRLGKNIAVVSILLTAISTSHSFEHLRAIPLLNIVHGMIHLKR
ncbi:hypothetical protein AZE42_10398 [Rhizopogon vesiculosus]|uniref:Uncharacterized protein n=1 Tax=Rhizopogon vesiculosus TaxID=180088 RepID=A0A1J8QG84_9AGAM|nr:hypothetical protein AZE42_10398 [Rhizopogon vesiculosus]